MNVPIVRLSVEGMRQEIATALTNYQHRMDSDVQKAVAECCTEENVRRVVHESAAREFNNVLNDEIRHFFHLGEGRKIIKQFVASMLDPEDPE